MTVFWHLIKSLAIVPIYWDQRDSYEASIFVLHMEWWNGGICGIRLRVTYMELEKNDNKKYKKP